MKMFKIMAAAFVALATASCVKDNSVDAAGSVYQASFSDAVGAKATIAVGAQKSIVSWEATDRVGIMYAGANLEYKADQAGERTTLSAVSTTASASEVWALLPYDADATLANGVISTSVPVEQPAKADYSFYHVAVAHSTNGSLAFSNVCGLVRVKVTTEGITKVVFAGKNNEKVAGNVSVTVADCSVAGADQENVSLVPDTGAASIPAGDYFLAVLPQTFANGFTVTAYKGSEAVITKEVAGPVELKRSGVFAGTIREVVISALSSDVLTTGETVKVSGTGFSAIAAENTVMVGDVSCEVSAASSTELSVVVPSGLEKATDYTFSVSVKGAAAPVASPKFRYYYLPRYDVTKWAGNPSSTAGDNAVAGGNIEGTDLHFYFPHGMCWDADGKLCVANATVTSAVHFIDMNTKETACVSTGKHIYGICSVGNKVYAANKGSNEFGVIVNGTYSKITLKSGDSDYSLKYTKPDGSSVNVNTMMADTDGTYLYFTLRDNQKVIKVEESSLQVVQEYTTIKPYAVALNNDKSKLFIGPNNTNSKIVMIDIASGEETHVAGSSTIPTDAGVLEGPAKSVAIGQVVAFLFDTDGYLYFSDQTACRLRVLIPGVGGNYANGIVKTVAGTAIGTNGDHGLNSDFALGDALTETKFGKEGLAGIVKYDNGFLLSAYKRHIICKLTPKSR